jgi:hypothetical protein
VTTSKPDDRRKLARERRTASSSSMTRMRAVNASETAALARAESDESATGGEELVECSEIGSCIGNSKTHLQMLV